MTNRLMLSVAVAALIAGTSFANAQGAMGHEGSSAGPAAQQSAPPAAGTSATTTNRDAAEPTKESTKPSPGMKATQSEPKSPTAGKNDHAQGDMKAGPKGEKSAQDNNMKGEKSKSMSSETTEKGAPAKDMKAEGREGRNGNMNAESKGAMDSKSATTVGQAGAGAKLSSEQRTKITTVIRDQHVAPVNDVKFSISVGTRVPREVSFHPLPAEVVTVYPEWRGYEYFLVRGEIIVVDPRTLEIVAVLEA
jgi:hypothetical protein